MEVAVGDRPRAEQVPAVPQPLLVVGTGVIDREDDQKAAPTVHLPTPLGEGIEGLDLKRDAVGLMDLEAQSIGPQADAQNLRPRPPGRYAARGRGGCSDPVHRPAHPGDLPRFSGPLIGCERELGDNRALLETTTLLTISSRSCRSGAPPELKRPLGKLTRDFPENAAGQAFLACPATIYCGPVSLKARYIAPPGRLELPTRGLEVRCSVRLSYGGGGGCLTRFPPRRSYTRRSMFRVICGFDVLCPFGLT